MAERTDTGERAQYLSFSLGGAEYGVGILQVREILQYEPVTRVPSTPRSVRGVINLRGQVVPVVDLAAKFALPEAPLTRLTCILIVEARMGTAPVVVGVMADEVHEVVELGREDVEPAPAFGTGVRVDFLAGVGKVGKRFVLLLDLDRVLSASERELACDAEAGMLGAAPPPGEAAEPGAAARRA